MALCPLSASIRPPQVIVRIQKDLSQVAIKGRDITRTFYIADLKKSLQYSGKKKIQFNCNKLAQYKQLKKEKLFAALSSKTGLLSLGNSKYRGDLLLSIRPKTGACDILNKTSLETYLESLLVKEMNDKWPIEALKAQAIAARTYALFRIRKRDAQRKNGMHYLFDLENSEKDQVGGSYFEATLKSKQAVRATRGMVLLNTSNQLLPIFFHASCGGRTLRPDHVWENTIADYQSVSCPYCHKSKKRHWSKQIKWRKFVKMVKKYNSVSLQQFVMIKDKARNAFVRFYHQGRLIKIKKSNFRRMFGRASIPSNYFTITFNKSRKLFNLVGNGLGHGVGMCQIGAYHMARNAKNHQAILAHYFPQYKISKWY